jgi:hypothetical protein
MHLTIESKLTLFSTMLWIRSLKLWSGYRARGYASETGLEPYKNHSKFLKFDNYYIKNTLKHFYGKFAFKSHEKTLKIVGSVKAGKCGGHAVVGVSVCSWNCLVDFSRLRGDLQSNLVDLSRL